MGDPSSLGTGAGRSSRLLSACTRCLRSTHITGLGPEELQTCTCCQHLHLAFAVGEEPLGLLLWSAVAGTPSAMLVPHCRHSPPFKAVAWTRWAGDKQVHVFL